MRLVGKFFRWLIVVIGIIEILGGAGRLLSPAPDAYLVNQQTGGNVTQQQIDDNHNNQRLGTAGVIVFWLVAISITMFFEAKSNKKYKKTDE